MLAANLKRGREFYARDNDTEAGLARLERSTDDAGALISGDYFQLLRLRPEAGGWA